MTREMEVSVPQGSILAHLHTACILPPHLKFI